MKFEEWLKELDRLFTRKFGLGYNDFPDYMWRDEYDADWNPEDAFTEWCLQTNDGLNA